MWFKEKCFQWQGINFDGYNCQGEAHAKSKRALKTTLDQKHIILRQAKIKKANKKIKSSIILILLKQLNEALASYISLLPALKLCQKQQRDKPVQKLIDALIEPVSQGESLYSAFKKRPDCFDDILCAFIHTAEKTGNLTTCIQYYIDYKTTLNHIKQQLMKMMIYPAIVFCTSIIIVTLMLVIVIPKFEAIYQNLGASLPKATQALLELSQHTPNIILSIFFVIFTATLTARFLKQYSNFFSEFINHLPLRMPGICFFYLTNKRIQWLQLVSQALKTGIPISESLSLGEHVLQNPILLEQCKLTQEKIHAGHSLIDSLQSNLLFDEQHKTWLSLAESTGRLDQTLEALAVKNQKQLQHIIDIMQIWIEPLLMLWLAIIIGGLIIVMYLPVFNLGKIL